MPIPKHVEEAGKRADEFMARQAGTPGTPAPEVKQAEPQPATPEAKVEPPNQTPAFDHGWETRFKVLQGKYDAEVPRLHGELRDLKAQLQAATDEIAALKTSAPVAPDLSALTPEEREQYGEDFLKVVAKVAAQQAKPTAPQVDPQLVDRLNRVESVVAETKEDEFFRKLGTKAANWEALNTDAKFLAWLAETDPLSGRTRQEMFTEAYHRFDVDRVATFFNTYGGNQSSVARADQIQPLDAQVTPRPNGSAPPPPQGKPFYTNRDIARFYDDVRRGAYRGREADMARIEQDIFAAQQEGRVR